jgi:hypothetical protein
MSVNKLWLVESINFYYKERMALNSIFKGDRIKLQENPCSNNQNLFQ